MVHKRFYKLLSAANHSTKLLGLCFLIVLSSLTLVSCNKESVGDSDDIVGKWHHEETNIYRRNTYSYRYIFEKKGTGLFYITMVEMGDGIGNEETSKRFTYSVTTNENYMVVTINYEDGKTDVFDDVYIIADVLHMDGVIYERM